MDIMDGWMIMMDNEWMDEYRHESIINLLERCIELILGKWGSI